MIQQTIIPEAKLPELLRNVYNEGMRNITPQIDGIYHVYNRGVEKRIIFPTEGDYTRFIRSLFELNDKNPVQKLYVPKKFKSQVIPEAKLPELRKPRELLVEILAFCLMPNHFHLILREIKEGGTRTFMHKLGTGYTNFFNQKYERVGSLFQGPYKIISVTNDSHLLYLPYYVHLNPLDLVQPEWRDGIIKDIEKATQYLEDYRWSSLPDYWGIKNYPSVTQRGFLENILGPVQEQKRALFDWIKRNELENIEHLALE